MFRWIAVLCAFFMASIATAITRAEIKANALVRFHWSESNKMRDNTKYGSDVRRRAQALDGQLATIMKPPFGPFWCKNPSRIVIQSLDDPDLILAVKQRNLESMEPIKIHLFHAKNDISTSDEYLEKEKRVLSSNNYTEALLTVHPDCNDEAGMGFCVGKCSFLDELRWYSLPILTQEDLRLQERERTVNRLKVSIKSVISRLLHANYRTTGGSFVDEVNDLQGYDQRFKNTLRIQLTRIARHNGTYQDMEWLRNNLIDWKWMAQGMHMIRLGIKTRMRMMAEEMLSPMTVPAQSAFLSRLSVINPLIVRSLQDIANQTNEQYGPSSYYFQPEEELLRSMIRNWGPMPLVPSMAANQEALMLLGMRDVLIRLAEHVKCIQEMTLIRNIGTTMAAVDPFVSQGSLEGGSIAIVIPGDLIPNLNWLEPLLYRIIKKLGWKYKCELKVFDI